MGVKLLPPRLYRSELASRESLRDTLLLVGLDTERKTTIIENQSETTKSKVSLAFRVARG